MKKNIILLCLFLGLFAVSCSNSKVADQSEKDGMAAVERVRETQKLANEKVNFYERVVRSVAREEKDILKHKENMSRLK